MWTLWLVACPNAGPRHPGTGPEPTDSGLPSVTELPPCHVEPPPATSTGHERVPDVRLETPYGRPCSQAS
jgi:hypothetical protein